MMIGSVLISTWDRIVVYNREKDKEHTGTLGVHNKVRASRRIQLVLLALDNNNEGPMYSYIRVRA